MRLNNIDYRTQRNRDLDNKPLDFSKCLWFDFGVGERIVNR